MADIFVSYRTGDESGVAILLDERLCARFGPDRVFRDNRSIGLGIDFRPELWGQLSRSSVLVAVIGPNWLGSGADGRRWVDDPDDFVRREIAWALTIGITVIPVLVGDAPKLTAGLLPDDIAALAYRQYRRLSGRGLQRDIGPLVDDIAAILAGSPGPSRPAGWESRRGTYLLLRPDPAGDADLDAVRAAVDLAAAEAGIAGVETAGQAFGLVVFVPAAVAPIRVVSGFLVALEIALAAGRAPDGGPLRAVAGVVESAAGADPRDALARLLARPEVAAVRRRATRAGVVLAVPDEFYDGVVRAHPEAADPATYLPLPETDGLSRTWLTVPGYPAPPGLRAQTHPVGPRAAATGGGPGVVNNGIIGGSQIGRDLNVGGDWVQHDKIVYGGE